MVVEATGTVIETLRMPMIAVDTDGGPNLARGSRLGALTIVRLSANGSGKDGRLRSIGLELVGARYPGRCRSSALANARL
jgi:hypothetical protein